MASGPKGNGGFGDGFPSLGRDGGFGTRGTHPETLAVGASVEYFTQLFDPIIFGNVSDGYGAQSKNQARWTRLGREELFGGPALKKKVRN